MHFIKTAQTDVGALIVKSAVRKLFMSERWRMLLHNNFCIGAANTEMRMLVQDQRLNTSQILNTDRVFSQNVMMLAA